MQRVVLDIRGGGGGLGDFLHTRLFISLQTHFTICIKELEIYFSSSVTNHFTTLGLNYKFQVGLGQHFLLHCFQGQTYLFQKLSKPPPQYIKVAPYARRTWD